MIQAVEQLFPKLQLVITHGSVSDGGNLPGYTASIVQGMSGGALLMNGKAIGNSKTLRVF
jgi:hypothetical protein